MRDHNTPSPRRLAQGFQGQFLPGGGIVWTTTQFDSDGRLGRAGPLGSDATGPVNHLTIASR